MEAFSGAFSGACSDAFSGASSGEFPGALSRVLSGAFSGVFSGAFSGAFEWHCAALSDVCEIRAASSTTARPAPHVVVVVETQQLELEADELQPSRP